MDRARAMRRIWTRLPLAAVFAAGVMACIPAIAGAATTWNRTNIACAADPAATAGDNDPNGWADIRAQYWGGGQTDEQGRLYVACGEFVSIRDTAGTEIARVPIPGYGAADVAPSPDGQYIYFDYVRGLDNDVPRRMVRTGAAGYTYTYDAGWSLPKVSYGNVDWEVRGRMMATDASGDLYVSNGGWQCDSPVNGTCGWGDFNKPTVIFKFRPQSAAHLTNDLVSIITPDHVRTNNADFATNFGLAVTRDGRTVYVAEQNGMAASSVWRLDYGADGGYHEVGSIGHHDVNCGTGGGLNGSYDVEVDAWGNLYVMNTTCYSIELFDSTGTWLGRLAVSGFNHGLAISAHGDIFAGQSQDRYTRTPSLTGAWPAITPVSTVDTADPVLVSVSVPPVTTSQVITVTITATDDVGVDEVRIAHEDGVWGAWQPYAATMQDTLTPGYTKKAVTVQVRDAAGKESSYATAWTSYGTGVVDAPKPVAKDLASPKLRWVRVPRMVHGRRVIVTLRATDDRAVYAMRFATENGRWGAWQRFRPRSTQRLSARRGPKVLFVQVKDRAGHQSVVKMVRTTMAA